MPRPKNSILIVLICLAGSLSACDRRPVTAIGSAVCGNGVVDLNEAQFYPAPSTMQGGVRLSPWDERMPIWAQAMAIMMLHEALKAMPVTVQSGEMTP